jgi:hypothetical protein
VTIAQHWFSTETHYRASEVTGAEPVLGKLATMAEVPTGTTDAGLPRYVLLLESSIQPGRMLVI